MDHYLRPLHNSYNLMEFISSRSGIGMIYYPLQIKELEDIVMGYKQMEPN